MAQSPPTPADLTVDKLPAVTTSLEVRFAEGASFGAAADRGPRAPHRHDYHELIWTRAGSGTHLIDDQPVRVRPGTLLLIGRGRVHSIQYAERVHGAVVRFGEELLHGEAAGRAGARWMVGTDRSHVVDVPAEHADRVEALARALADEHARPADSRSLDLQRHYLSALLLLSERWYEDGSSERLITDQTAIGLYRRFADLLERYFARHVDAVHYADALAVPQATLSKTLVQATGRTTKEHITDRRLLEAARLLRFTTLTVGEIAFRAGYSDQLYFSRASRRHYGVAPTDYRSDPRTRT